MKTRFFLFILISFVSISCSKTVLDVEKDGLPEIRLGASDKAQQLSDFYLAESIGDISISASFFWGGELNPLQVYLNTG